MTFAATVLTLYPEMFPGPLGVSLAGRALAEGKWSLDCVQIRDFATDKHRSVDDTPSGGGAGMVLRADVLAAAVDHAVTQFLPGTGRGASVAGGGAQAMITGPSDIVKRARRLRSEMTLPEGVLWRELRKRPKGLKFRRQHPAGIYVLDFYCAATRLAIEVDGWVHDNARAQTADAARGHFLRSQGIATLQVPAMVVLEDLPLAVARIVEVCGERVGREPA